MEQRKNAKSTVKLRGPYDHIYENPIFKRPVTNIKFRANMKKKHLINLKKMMNPDPPKFER
jgi:hypothetical protein